MKNCLRIPRVLIPREGFEKWAVIACDQFTSDRGYWKRVERAVGDSPSALNYILPEAFLGENDEARIAAASERMYADLEDGVLEKLNRGFIFTERTTPSGIRRGVVGCIDLEQYSFERGEKTPIRSSEEVVKDRLPARVALRRAVPLEFPHALVFYRDKKNKVGRYLAGEDLEELYDFELMEGGGRLRGSYIPEDLSEDVAAIMHTRGTSFAVADGNHSVAAAKLFWEELKPSLKGEQLDFHPARFMLVELVNLYDESIFFHPIYRIVQHTDAEALAALFQKEMKVRREGNLIHLIGKGPAPVAKCDALLERFVKEHGGSIDYIHGEEELSRLAAEKGSLGVMPRPLEKDDFFDYLDGGVNLPKKCFSIGEAREKRYYFEGREISYD